MKQYRITLEGDTFDVKILDDPRQEQVRVEVNGETFTVGVGSGPPAVGATAREASLPTPPSPALAPSAAPGNRVTAPLPGVIKSILVQPGQQVAPGDEIMVIEAMKMDNAIRAARAGTVDTIHVAEGRQVAHGEPLLTYAN